jgi:dTDP-4-dehydrorhamnose 3,5-epimerase
MADDAQSVRQPGEAIAEMIKGQRDSATVRPDGQRLMKMIEGVSLRTAVTHPDERGELCEIYNPAWGVHPDPLVYIYMATIRPQKIKGWVYHEKQDDRIFVVAGSVKAVLCDLRDGSPTKGLINEFFITERNRALLVIPRMVAHALQNIGTADAVFVNSPTAPYNHAAPDKTRIPPNSPEIPYSFDVGPGR